MAGVSGEVEVLLGEVGLHPELRSHGESDDGGHGGRVGRGTAVGQDGEEHCIRKVTVSLELGYLGTTKHEGSLFNVCACVYIHLLSEFGVTINATWSSASLNLN